MQFNVGLENGDENRSVAWVFGHPGCYAYGPDPQSALSAAPQAIRDYAAWIENHCEETWLDGGDCQVNLAENYDVFFTDENYDRVTSGYGVNAWFWNDWKPLEPLEVERTLRLLEWSRADLLETTCTLPQAVLDRSYPGERWSIAGILKHVAGAEWWYLDRLGLAFPRAVLHNDTYERLEKVRAHLVQVLPTLVGAIRVNGIDGEFWSPRKMLRRAVWHERDHTQHILKLLTPLTAVPE